MSAVKNLLGILVIYGFIFGIVFTIPQRQSSMTTTMAPADNETEYDIEAIFNDCNESFTVSMDYIISLNDSGTFPDETEKTPMCFLACVLKKMDVVSKDGQIDKDAVLGWSELFVDTDKEKEKVKQATEKCVKERNEKCVCLKSYNLVKCLWNEIE